MIAYLIISIYLILSVLSCFHVYLLRQNWSFVSVGLYILSIIPPINIIFAENAIFTLIDAIRTRKEFSSFKQTCIQQTRNNL